LIILKHLICLQFFFVVYQIFYFLSFFNDKSINDKKKSQDHVND